MKTGIDLAVQQAQKGKKITQQAALTAMMETKTITESLMNTVGRLAQAQSALENILERLDTTMGVLLSLLLKDKKVFTEEDWSNAWDTYVVKPREEALHKHIEQLKEQGGEDKYYGEVLERVLSFEFEEKEIQGRKLSGADVKEFYVQMLVNPATRGAAADDLRTNYMKDLPEFNKEEALNSAIEKLKVEAEQAVLEQEENTHPECHYCGRSDCEFCNPPGADKE
ncbi:MAG: hypothetical protein DRN26_00310 [Thermoplasmata archaeon]|nr:MAG: hypothetical protein DRN26_00310 [Thermoplasmata archaeon]